MKKCQDKSPDVQISGYLQIVKAAPKFFLKDSTQLKLNTSTDFMGQVRRKVARIYNNLTVKLSLL